MKHAGPNSALPNARRMWPLLLLALAFSSCSGRDGGDFAERPDLMLITVDTFRADHAGSMGHPGGLTPFLDRIVRRGILARNAYAPVPLTAPSHATLLTGVRPPSHGVRENGSFYLSESVPTLAELLQEKGFRTGGFVAAFPLEGRFGFSRGFECYDDFVGATRTDASYYAERPAAEVVDSTLAWVAEVPRGDPLFLWTHFFDPHYPRDVLPALRKLPATDDYGREIRGMDCEIRRLWQGLERVRGRLPIVAVSSDHGEALGEHGEPSHGVLLYEGTTRGFFGVTAPSGSGAAQRLGTGIFEGIVRFSDLVPTLFDLADLELTTEVEGRSLLMERSEVLGVYSETYYPLLHYGWSPLLSWRENRWSYVDSPDPELFDRWQDPGETRNVIAEHPEVVARMSKQLGPLVREPEEPQAESIPDEVREKLAALGYLASSAPTRVDRGKNPRDLIGAVAAMYRGMTHRAAGNYDAALSYFQRAYSIDPDNAENVFQLANCLRLMGDAPSAMEYYRQAIEMTPGGGMAYAHLAMLELDTGQAERAWRTLETGLAESPRNHALLMTAGDMHFEIGELEKAKSYYLRAREEEPRSVDPWIRLAEVATEQGREEDARVAWKRALELDPVNPQIPEQVRRTFARR